MYHPSSLASNFFLSSCSGRHERYSLSSAPFDNVSRRIRSEICPCGRRHFLAAMLPTLPAHATRLPSDPMIAGYKTQLFTHLRGENKKVLELGVGTGPNFKYYASTSGIRVFGVDPNKRMEKYAQAAAVAAGLPSTHFSFIQAVGEALPISDASMDAVIGTLVLCSVNDVDMTMKEVKRVLKPGGRYIFIEHVAANDGTPLRLLQKVVDPLQQIVSDGCHLTRETGKTISEAGFSDANVNMAFLSSVSLISPHAYGVACK